MTGICAHPGIEPCFPLLNSQCPRIPPMPGLRTPTPPHLGPTRMLTSVFCSSHFEGPTRTLGQHYQCPHSPPLYQFRPQTQNRYFTGESINDPGGHPCQSCILQARSHQKGSPRCWRSSCGLQHLQNARKELAYVLKIRRLRLRVEMVLISFQ